MIQIGLDDNIRIVEDSCRFEEADDVLEQVGSGLAIIPLKPFQFQLIFLEMPYSLSNSATRGSWLLSLASSRMISRLRSSCR